MSINEPTETSLRPYDRRRRSLQTGVSWDAIWAGATVAVVISLVLTLAAAGLGYDLAPSGLQTRRSLQDFTPAVGAYAIVVQVLAGALGGYLTGRLRTAWFGLHDDESHFRDTAHGLIAWAVATLGGLVLAMLVFVPYSRELMGTAAIGAADSIVDPQRSANIAAQSSLFIAIGMLLSAFVAAVAARIGGMRTEEMHAKGLG